MTTNTHEEPGTHVVHQWVFEGPMHPVDLVSRMGPGDLLNPMILLDPVNPALGACLII